MNANLIAWLKQQKRETEMMVLNGSIKEISQYQVAMARLQVISDVIRFVDEQEGKDDA